MITAIREALAELRSERKRRQTVARDHTWDARMDAIEAALEATQANRRLCQDPLSSPS
jgi:hypothetical protein